MIRLRLVREADLGPLFDFHQDISNRGDFFPIGVASMPAFQNLYRESGFWGDKAGLLIITGEGDEILGHIEFYETVDYLGYLFEHQKINRIRLVIHPDNAPSRRVALKAGYTYEGVARGAWFHRGRNHDVEVWSLLRDEYVGAQQESP